MSNIAQINIDKEILLPDNTVICMDSVSKKVAVDVALMDSLLELASEALELTQGVGIEVNMNVRGSIDLFRAFLEGDY